jgi:hypothetical protein
MVSRPDALLLDLLEDLSPYLSLSEYSARKAQIQPWDRVDTVAAKLLVNSFLKKFRYTATKEADQRALEKFEAINDGCKLFKVECHELYDDIFWGELRKEIHSALVESDLIAPCFGQILDHGRLGPGASLKARGTDFYTKMFDSPISCTKSSLYGVLRRHFQSDPRWNEALELSAQTWGGCEVVEGNRISFVPKDDVITRSICTEPSGNMFFQLGLGRLIEDMLFRRYGLNIRRLGKYAPQTERNQALACAGSELGVYSTIDLQSASDSMSLNLARFLFPRHFMAMLEYLRSPCSYIGDRRIDLHMVSTMGNGFTFPLQTFLFTCVVVTCYRMLGIKTKYPRGSSLGNLGVYGDDIVVATEANDYICRKLTLLGFRVNRDKSFDKGAFRESCGGDFFRGHPVRGVYAKSVDTVQDRYVLVNRLIDWTRMTGIPVPRVCRSLIRTVPLLEVPLAENADSGIRTPFNLLTKKPVLDRDTQSVKYRRWVARPARLRVVPEERRIYVPKGSRVRNFNPEGLLLCFLARSLDSCIIAVRHDDVIYEKKVGISPNWDMIPTGLGGFHLGGRTSHEEAFLLNLRK